MWINSCPLICSFCISSLRSLLGFVFFLLFMFFSYPIRATTWPFWLLLLLVGDISFYLTLWFCYYPLFPLLPSSYYLLLQLVLFLIVFNTLLRSYIYFIYMLDFWYAYSSRGSYQKQPLYLNKVGVRLHTRHPPQASVVGLYCIFCCCSRRYLILVKIPFHIFWSLITDSRAYS